jgi:hypothetical protein
VTRSVGVVLATEVDVSATARRAIAPASATVFLVFPLDVLDAILD